MAMQLTMVSGSLPERFFAKLAPPTQSGCIEFMGKRQNKGYGHIGSGGHKGRTLLAHRVAWELANGPIPDGLLVCHRCDNPPCCNPEHLFLGTKSDNALDQIGKGRPWNRTKGHRVAALPGGGHRYWIARDA